MGKQQIESQQTYNQSEIDMASIVKRRNLNHLKQKDRNKWKGNKITKMKVNKYKNKSCSYSQCGSHRFMKLFLL